MKSAKLRKQEKHLETVTKGRSVYQDMVTDCKVAVSGFKLGRNNPCSLPGNVHYSFDFAQQVHYPNDPLQPGPMYFLCPRKCGVFRICCESIPQ